MLISDDLGQTNHFACSIWRTHLSYHNTFTQQWDKQIRSIIIDHRDHPIFLQEALKLAQETGNRSVYARCLCSMANICRDLGESEAKETLTVSFFLAKNCANKKKKTESKIVYFLGNFNCILSIRYFKW